MLRVLEFTYNLFQEKTYLVFDDEADLADGLHPCIAIDPGCLSDGEKANFKAQMEKNRLKPVAILLSHCHFDHIGGVKHIQDKFFCPVYMNPSDKVLLRYVPEMAGAFGISVPENDFETTDISDGQLLEIGGMKIKCISTPGHSPGGMCFHFEEEAVLFSGDTLFAGTIGRSDLPLGDYDELIRSVMEKLIFLDGETRVFPGHGDSTSIGHERTHNPFLEPFNEPEEKFDMDEIEPISLSGLN